tara:strand:+ start:1083 stop:2840 length:1758 start_codon:yes stop_codon:yes gene_type:complete
MKISDKLKKIRSLMKNLSIDCYLIPHSDEFSNEFLPPYSRRLEWISDFTGSAGDVIITDKKAYLFVDGRYTIQASQEVDSYHYQIFNYKDKSVLDLLSKIMKKQNVIGFDGNIEKFKKIEILQKKLGKDIKIKPVDSNLIDLIWKNRPKKLISSPFKLPFNFHGEDKLVKIKKIIRHIKTNKRDAYISTSCDSICWLFNIRAQDLEYSPLIMAKSIIHGDGNCFIFSDQKTLKNETLNHKIKIIYKPLHHFDLHFNEYKDSIRSYLCAPKDSSFNAVMSIKEIGATVIFKDNIIDILKAKKNITEENGMRNAHIRDGVALTKFIYWIKNTKNNSQSEISASNYLDNLRSKNKNFFSLSFPTIAGSGPNGAIVHYRASKKTNRKLKKDDLFLVDSGAQYFDGTTDVTRTIAFSKVTNEQKKMYTLVLKGHIAVALSTFNEKESGKTLDRHARKFLKKEKLNFDHGTGHGVGCFLNVHESPPSISPLSKHKFKKGMIVSNEPGFYKKNKYGIRIENLVLSRKKQSRLYFETLTVAPLEPKLIDFKLLTSVEMKWLKNYHSKVYKSVAGFLNNKEKMWLQNEISSLTV